MKKLFFILILLNFSCDRDTPFDMDPPSDQNPPFDQGTPSDQNPPSDQDGPTDLGPITLENDHYWIDEDGSCWMNGERVDCIKPP